MSDRLDELLNRQKEINIEFIRLAEESSRVIEEIEILKVLSEKNANSIKDGVSKLVKTKLRNQGYTIENSRVEGTQVITASKGGNTVIIGVRGSKFHAEDYNAWYTLDGKSSEQIDFQVLGYMDNRGTENFVVLPNEVVLELTGQIKGTNDEKYHLFLRGNDKYVKEIKSGIDLSKYLNSLDFFE